MSIKVHRVRMKVWSLTTVFFICGLIIFGARRVSAKDLWTENTPPVMASYTWVGLASSSNGKYLAAASGSSPVYLSDDFGESWESSGPSSNWASIASSGDGQEIAAITAGGYIELTLNHGVDWSHPCVDSCHGVDVWYSISMSADGQYLAAAGGYGIWVSDDNGTTWADSGLDPDFWKSVAYSPDGNTLVAAKSSGYIYVSTNHGADWDRSRPASDNDWAALTAENNGKIAAVGGYDSSVWTSSDYGENWNDTGFGSDFLFESNALASSADGKYLIIAPADDNPAFISTDSGAHWKAQSGPEGDWFSVVSNEDGSRLAVGGYSSVWTYRRSTTSGSSVGGQASGTYLAQLGITLASSNTPTVKPTENTLSSISEIKKVIKDLKFGLTNADVKILQQFLIDQNKGPAALLLKNHGITDFFGKLTESALAEWQKANGITPSVGYFGSKTRAFIASI